MFKTLCIGSPRVEGDDDEEDVDDIEHEFNIEDEQNKNKHLTEAMLHGKMTYGRGHGDEENSHFPPVITGIRSRPVSEATLCFDFKFNMVLMFLEFLCKKILAYKYKYICAGERRVSYWSSWRTGVGFLP